MELTVDGPHIVSQGSMAPISWERTDEDPSSFLLVLQDPAVPESSNRNDAVLVNSDGNSKGSVLISCFEIGIFRVEAYALDAPDSAITKSPSFIVTPSQR